jgi:hypothetical protein
MSAFLSVLNPFIAFLSPSASAVASQTIYGRGLSYPLLGVLVAPEGEHRQRLRGNAEVVRHTAVEEVQEVHHNLTAGSSELLGIAEGALLMAIE